MIYPLLPVFFSGLVPPAAVAVYIGLMEGLAESTASLLKFYVGRLSDRFNRRKPLTLVGYAISSAVRPFTAIAAAGWQVVVFRLFDRIGKGIRTAPRDALLSESVTAEVRGRAFSFHRLMDHAGAVTGPLVAIAFLYRFVSDFLRPNPIRPGPRLGDQPVGPAASFKDSFQSARRLAGRPGRPPSGNHCRMGDLCGCVHCDAFCVAF